MAAPFGKLLALRVHLLFDRKAGAGKRYDRYPTATAMGYVELQRRHPAFVVKTCDARFGHGGRKRPELAGDVKSPVTPVTHRDETVKCQLSLQSPLARAYKQLGKQSGGYVSSTMTESNTVEQERGELHAVLESDLFVRSPTLAHLLSYLCEKMFAGEGDHIKEYSIAVDVLGRRDTFDQDIDSIVRVQANRLRKRLAEFYTGDGAGHRLHITIPVGQYVPVFQDATGGSAPAAAGHDVTKTGAPPAPRQVRKIWLLLAPIGLLLLLSGAGFVLRHRLRPQAVVSPVSRTATTEESSVGLPVGDEVRILAGATRNFVDRSGKAWSSDTHFSGGAAVRSAVAYMWRTQDPTIYRTSRQGDFSYDVPLKPGTYELHLHFAETFYGPEDAGGGGEGSRIMTVTANGKPLLVDFDALADAGGGRIADVRVFADIRPADDGLLHLNFSSMKGGRAMVSAIELLPGIRGQLRPVRIVARDVPYYSDDSRWWSADMYFKGGQLRATEQTAAATDDPELYATERWGHFSYAIPVAPGKYALTLYFIERHFRANHGQPWPDPGTSSGMRLFNVFGNRKLLLHDVNILEEVGENRPLVRKFTGLLPNAQGKLLLEFVPTRDYATVSAIEVVPQ